MDQKNFKFLFTILLLILSSVLISNADSMIYFHDGFEYTDDLEDRDYIINKDSDPDMIAEPNRFAASTGERGLLMKSELSIEWVEIVIPLNIDFSNDIFFSFHVKLISNTATVRLELKDGDNILSLDYGQNWTGWEKEPNYDVQEPFILDQWIIVNRKLSDDLITALNEENSTFSDFSPTKISSIKIIQDNHEGLNELYLDEIEISGQIKENTKTNSEPNISTLNGPTWFLIGFSLILIKVVFSWIEQNKGRLSK